VLTFSETLGDVINAVLIPIRQLAMTAWLFLVVMIVFGTFATEFFGPDRFDTGCETRLQCFSWVLYYGYQGGAVWSAFNALNTVEYGNPLFLQRLVFDLLFYTVLGVLLFNLVTGVMLDAFGTLRDGRAEREDCLRNSCFICALTREEFEQLGPEFSFARHKRMDHNLWWVSGV
jgi:hypothetical protein